MQSFNEYYVKDTIVQRVRIEFKGHARFEKSSAV